MASDKLRAQILEQLRSGQTSSKVIAQQLGVSVQVVMGVKSHWTSGKCFTRGRRWHLLAVQRFSTRQQAFAHEDRLKKSLSLKMEWKIASIERASRIVAQHGYSFVPDHWNPIF